MDERNLIQLLPFWLLIAPPVLALLSTFMDGTWSRQRDTERDRS